MYRKFVKRLFDIGLSLFALIVLSPLLLILTVVGTIAMKGNPFFIQKRPGMIDKKTGMEKTISLVKFRTMNNRHDDNGKLLSDGKRLTTYGRFIRSTSLDELPSLVNILIGDLSVCGPRPLFAEYLPYYTPEERRRHKVRPGLTGWAQVNGRNSVPWDKRFKLDIEYVDNMSFAFDLKIVFLTVKKIFIRSDVADDSYEVEGNFAEIRENEQKGNIQLK